MRPIERPSKSVSCQTVPPSAGVTITSIEAVRAQVAREEETLKAIRKKRYEGSCGR